MNTEDLNECILDYIDIDEQIKSLTKQKEILKNKLCAYMDEERVDKVTANTYSISRSVSHRTTVDEGKMVSIVKSWGSGVSGLIKTREYVDTDVLEDVAYKGLITPTELKQLDSCRKVTEVTTLRTSKRKGG